jgi:hypothetical protein
MANPLNATLVARCLSELPRHFTAKSVTPPACSTLVQNIAEDGLFEMTEHNALTFPTDAVTEIRARVDRQTTFVLGQKLADAYRASNDPQKDAKLGIVQFFLRAIVAPQGASVSTRLLTTKAQSIGLQGTLGEVRSLAADIFAQIFPSSRYTVNLDHKGVLTVSSKTGELIERIPAQRLLSALTVAFNKTSPTQ